LDSAGVPARGVTLIVVTHALELAKRMGRVLRLADGELLTGELP